MYAKATKPKKTQLIPNAVVIYLRVSTEDQGKSGLGLDAQLETCTKVATQLGKTIVGIYTEIVSGKVDPRERPVFTEAITKAQATGASLMVAKQDRFSREVFHVSGYVNGYFYGATSTPTLISADSPQASPMEVYLRAVVAEEERKLISKRTKEALAQLKKQGVVIGEKSRALIHERARELTKDAMTRAVELRRQKLTLESIADTLNAEGYLTSRGTAWTKQALSKRLSAVAG
ncbi:recombinase family protein [Fortiea contorta]|uniref:recombinase family protein n=1 Tax=Fortiea contorta TaxID=1892405 RepID=UPI00034CF412|nr:recombinase family protein [Fortiea contorta]